MASTPRVRLAVLATSSIVAAGVGWAALARFGGTHGVGLVDGSDALAVLLAERDPNPVSVAGLGPFVLEPMDAETVEKMAIVQQNHCVFDEDCYYRYLPHVVDRRTWPEHPDGAWVRRTNAAGLREDDDAGLADADLGVLVVGDSHTDGVCSNAESFPNLLEARLAARWPDERVEVLNAGVVGYTFFNYLGVLRKHLAQRPDVFVVAVYGGNDFDEVLRYHHWFRGTQPPVRRPSFWERIDAAKAVSHVYVAQSLNQALYFQEHPEEIDVAFEGAVACTREIRRLCLAAGVRLVFVYVPPAYEASWPELDALTAKAEEALALSPTDLAVARRLGDRFVAELRELGIDCIEAGPLFRAQTERCYWNTDLHINLLGHEVIAAALDAHLSAGGGELGPLGALALPDGPYVERDADGRALAEGEIVYGLRSGAWTVSFPGGGVSARGAWRAGRRHGAWEWFYEDGTSKKRGAYEDERPVGAWEEWYRDGTPRLVGAYRDGTPHGRWREWHPSGALASEGDYGAGGREGLWRTWYEDGAPKSTLTFRADAFHGPAESWHRDGARSMRGWYVDGERSGHWEFWYAGGAPSAAGSYDAGARAGRWTFWKRGGAVDAERSGEYVAGERALENE
jgi:antitoxin component YwqK of YwqJK toxin-antitoxin module